VAEERLSRDRLPFRAVNRAGAPGYQPDLQRHHLLPRQLLNRRCFAALFERVVAVRLGFDDFRLNGLLLPSSEKAALRTGLPLHRGPHRSYNELVIERVGQIEADWQRRRSGDPAGRDASARLSLLQRALRRRLLTDRRGTALLHRQDPARCQSEFALLDSMADQLWPATELDQAASSSAFAA
jgi:hypothetical protein